MQVRFTGVACDDHRIVSELIAMGHRGDFYERESRLTKYLNQLVEFVTWLRWKGEVNVYGCRVGAQAARRREAMI